MFRNSILAAALALAAIGTAQAEPRLEGDAASRRVAYEGTLPTQVGGAVAHLETTGDGPTLVTDRATGAQQGLVAQIIGGGDDLQIVYVAPARAPRG